MILVLGVIDLGEQFGEGDLRIVLFKLAQHLVRFVIDGDVGKALGPRDREAEHLAPAHLGQRALFGKRVAHRGEIGQIGGAAIAQRDLGLTQIIGVARVADDPNRLFGPGDFGAAAGGVQIHLTQLGVDLRRGDAQRLHPGGVQDDADFARNPAQPLDTRHAGNRQQFLGNGIVDIPAKLFQRQIGRVGRNERQVAAADVDALDLGFQDSVR